MAFVTVRRDQRDEQLFWLALLQSVQATLDDGNANEPPIATPVFNAEAMVDRVLSYVADYPGRLVRTSGSSRRPELRVLRFLPTNMSLEIARELYISVNTVNTYVRNIYAKLGARDRSTAVDRPRELRLLSTSASH